MHLFHSSTAPYTCRVNVKNCFFSERSWCGRSWFAEVFTTLELFSRYDCKPQHVELGSERNCCINVKWNEMVFLYGEVWKVWRAFIFSFKKKEKETRLPACSSGYVPSSIAHWASSAVNADAASVWYGGKTTQVENTPHNLPVCLRLNPYKQFWDVAHDRKN